MDVFKDESYRLIPSFENREGLSVHVNSNRKDKNPGFGLLIFNLCVCHAEQSHLCFSVSALPVQKLPHSK